MALVTYEFVFSAGTTIIASEHNSNFSVLYTLVNGNLNNSNIVAGAAIANAKLNLASIAQDVAISGDLDLTGAANDWSGATISDAGIITTVDINGGTIDGTNIGAAVQGTGHVSTLKVGTTNQGDILYDNGTSLVRLTPGTNGYYLKTQGAGANPLWADNTPVAGASGFLYEGLSTPGTPTTWTTEVYDIGGDATSTTFTAPTSGKYLFTLHVDFKRGSGAGARNSSASLVTTSKTYTFIGPFTETGDTTGSECPVNGSVVADMSATDTATVNLAASGTSWTYGNGYWSCIQIA